MEKQQWATPDKYDPFARGRFPVGVRTVEALDPERNRLFPCEIWYPAAAHHAGQDLAPGTEDTFPVPQRDNPRRQMAVRNAAPEPGTYPLIAFSHGTAASRRRMATYLCTHFSSHGYLVAALDHSETVAVELAPGRDETAEQKAARVEAWIANRVPDIRFLLDYLLGTGRDQDFRVDPAQIGIAGFSFGGWTALAAAAADLRIGAVVALAPGGSSQPKPGIISVTLDFDWGRDVPVLYLAAENDVMTPLTGIYELFERTQATKRMVILRRADHMHFADDVEQEHEAVRRMPFTGILAWIPEEMRPVEELCSGEQANLFVRGLALCHMDAALRQLEEARQFLAGDIEAELAGRGVAAIAHQRGIAHQPDRDR